MAKHREKPIGIITTEDGAMLSVCVGGGWPGAGALGISWALAGGITPD